MSMQTPYEGAVTAPWIVTGELFGPEAEWEPIPVLAQEAVRRFDRDETFRVSYAQGHERAGDHTLLMAMDHDLKIRNGAGTAGARKVAAWQHALHRVGPELSTAVLQGAGLEVKAESSVDPMSRLATVSGPTTDAEAVDLARALAADLHDLAGEASVTGGHVHVDAVAAPYERMVAGFALAERWSSVDRVPGYSWTVLLTERHVEALGGTDACRRSAPVWRAVPVGDRRVLCTLTEHPLALSEGVVRAWRDFLRPVLPRGFPGPPRTGDGTVRPCWIYEGPFVPLAAAMAVSMDLDPDDRTGTVGTVHPTGELRIDLPDGARVELVDAARAVANAWGVAGLAPRVADPVAFSVGPGLVEDLRPVPFEAGDQRTAERAVQRLAVALGRAAGEVDPGGSGPFGSIEVVTS